MARKFQPREPEAARKMVKQDAAEGLGPGFGPAIDWQAAYDNRGAIPGAEATLATWADEARAFRAGLGARAEWCAYGPHARQSVDLLRPEGELSGLAVFVHGGYWQRGAPAEWTHLAAGALARGWAVALPGYRLCPEVTVRAITDDVAAAIALAAGAVPGPIRLAGHSAGGHLVMRMLSGGASPAVLDRVEAVLSISGLHDLRPLVATPLNAALGLDLASARAESPAFAEPCSSVPVTAWVGADELPELRRQSRILAELWGGLGHRVAHVEDAGHDHLSVVTGLSQAEAPITAEWLDRC